MNIVISGSIAFDYLMSFPGRFKDHILPDQIDHLSVSFLVDSMDKRRGGIAPNMAYSLALLGERPIVLGTCGQDFSDYRHWLDQNGVDTSSIVEIPDQFTASFFVNTDLDNNQIASFYTGAMAFSHQLSVNEIHQDIDLLVVSPDDPRTMVKRPNECKELGIPYVFDPSQQIIRLCTDELKAGIDGAFLLILNEYEFDMIREKTGWNEKDVLQRTKGLIITLGAKGARILVDEKEYLIPTFPASRIADPTGVGDAFRAGLLRGFSLGFDWEISGRMGSLAAAFVLENVGTQSHNYTREEFISRFREHFDDKGVLDALRENI